ncbi:MAG TPA: cell wall-binding repeat-containing protein [Acidothermaceae bacterium]
MASTHTPRAHLSTRRLLLGATLLVTGLVTGLGAMPTAPVALAAGDGTVAPALVPALTPPATVVDRIAGSDRFATAVAASVSTFPATASASAVVLASGDSYPDALVGVTLTASLDAPLLLTSGATLPSATKNEIVRVLPAGGTVYLLGGTASVPNSIAAQLATMGYHTTRYAGADRFGTALAVAAALGNPSTVMLVDGSTFADALAAGPAAAHVHAAVLLTNGSSLPAADAAYLAAHHGTVYGIGTAGHTADPAAIPVFGVGSSSSTSAAVAAKFFTAPTAVGIATSGSFPDALAGGAQVAHLGGPLLLNSAGAIENQVGSYLTAHAPTITLARIYGGTSGISAAVSDAARSALGLSNPLANTSDLGSTAARCTYVVGYRVNVSGVVNGYGAPDLFEQQTVLAVVHAAVADLSSRTGQTYRYDGTTSFVPTLTNYSHGPDDLVITVASPTSTNFFASAPAGEQFGAYTRWQLDGSGSSVVAISPAMLALPSGLNDAGGASLYAIVQHKLGHSVGLQHSPNPLDVMYFQANPKTPSVYSPADTALLAKSLCRS